MDPAGRFSTNYARDRALVRTPLQALACALLLAALVLAPLYASPRLLSYLTALSISVVAAVGLQITMGYAGQINLGQSAFMGVGAYAAAVLSSKASLPFWLTIPLAGLVASFVGYLFGLSAARIKGFYLALSSVAAQVMFPFAVLNFPAGWLGGANGLNMAPAQLFGVRIVSETHFYLLSLSVCLLMIYAAFGIARSRFGRAFMAVRDDELASGMSGLPVAHVKAFSFMVGAFFAGVAGSLLGYQLRFINFDQFTLFASIWFIGMIIVGGLGSIVGAIIGTALILGVQETLTFLGPVLIRWVPGLGQNVVFASMNLILGALMVACLIFEPRGLMYRWNLLKQLFRRWPFPY